MTQTADQGTAECKRPGCGSAVPPGAGRGRHRVFCSDECARRYHNDARIPVPAASGGSGDGDPLAALEQALRQAAVLARAARDPAAALDPARVARTTADTETARARQAEADAREEAQRPVDRTTGVSPRVPVLAAESSGPDVITGTGDYGEAGSSGRARRGGAASGEGRRGARDQQSGSAAERRGRGRSPSRPRPCPPSPSASSRLHPP